MRQRRLIWTAGRSPIRSGTWSGFIVSLPRGRQQEPIEIDFEAVTGAVIPCLAQPESSPDYAAYLAIIPGTVLAKLYGDYGSRLLERNVRSFLQARGKINMGIRRTILKEPHMFLAYNNGLSATAESVEVVDMPGGGLGIKSIKDFQVVNGGQTTASIFHALKRDKADLSALFVQAKLTVISSGKSMNEIVPLISEYANSQNKVQTADFAANDVYHRGIGAAVTSDLGTCTRGNTAADALVLRAGARAVSGCLSH